MTPTSVLLLVSVVILTSDVQTIGGSCPSWDGSQGTCVGVTQCNAFQIVLSEIVAGIRPKAFIKKTICFSQGRLNVCCPRPRQSTPSNRPNQFQQSGLSGGSSLLPRTCGRSEFTDRIIAGEPAPLGAWPWMVILRGIVDGRSTWFCGGTLISDRYVLSAAHCFPNSLQLEFARVGEHTLQQDPDCTIFGKCAPSPIDIPVERIINHHSYGRPCSRCNDIALLRLSRRVDLNRGYVRAICLPSNPRQDIGFSVEQFQGKVAWATGWGTISKDRRTPNIPKVLQQVQLPINNQFCTFQKRSYPDQSMVLCAGGENKDTCQGDSGGPLILESNVGSTNFIVGITSRGPLVCGARSTQGLFTSVHHYLSWITSNLQP